MTRARTARPARPARPVPALVAILALALAVGAATGRPAAAQAPGEAEAANRALAEAFVAAWNAHDMQAFGRLLTRDVDWVNVDAGHGRGWVPVVGGHERVHAGKFRESVMTLQRVDVARLAPDVALVHVAWGLRGDRNDDDSPREPREGLFTWVTVRDGDAWKIRASHNTNRGVVR